MNIIQITDFSDERLDVYARFTENQLKHIYEPDTGMFIAESPIVIERALDAGYIPVSVLMEDKHVETCGKKIIDRCPDIPIFIGEFDLLTKLTGFKLTRGMLCAMMRKPMGNLRDIINGKKRIAVMDDVVNPTNVGAIFRSAAALNMEAVILTSNCSDPLYRRSLRVSMGNVFLVPWIMLDFDSTGDYIEVLQENGFKTAAMALSEDSVSIDDKELLSEEKIAIVLGSEGYGLTKETIDKCDYTVKIPMADGVDSLNVAAASAVAFWQLSR